MEIATAEAVPVPPQHTQQPLIDFRNSAHGPRGYAAANKRKVDALEEQAQQDDGQRAMQTDDMYSTTAQPSAKRQKPNNNIGVGFANGKPWKLPGERAGTLKNPLLSTSWEAKMKFKAEKAAFKAMKDEAIFAQQEKAARAKKQREEAKARKEANKQKSAVTQNITSNATLRKMMKSKKQRKLLRKADTLEK